MDITMSIDLSYWNAQITAASVTLLQDTLDDLFSKYSHNLTVADDNSLDREVEFETDNVTDDFNDVLKGEFGNQLLKIFERFNINV